MQVGDNLHGRERLPFRFIPNIQTRCTKIRKQIPIHVPIWDAVPQAFQFIYLVLPVSTCFHLGNNTLQKLHRFRFTGHSGDHSPPNAAIPSSHAPRIPTFSACRVAASNRTRDRTNVSPLVQTNACSVRCSPRGTPHRPP